jgi:hypothetical protein
VRKASLEIRDRLASNWDIPPGRSAVAEVYPELWSRCFDREVARTISATPTVSPRGSRVPTRTDLGTQGREVLCRLALEGFLCFDMDRYLTVMTPRARALVWTGHRLARRSPDYYRDR